MALSTTQPQFPEVELPKIPKGYHDLGFRYHTTLAPGCFNPIFAFESLPADSMEYGFHGQLESFPMLAPCLDGFKFRMTYHYCNLANWYGYLDNDSKTQTREFVSKMNFWTFVPLPVNALALTTKSTIWINLFQNGYPISTASKLTAAQYGWMNPSLASNIYLNGVAPGSLLNRLGVPVGVSGRYSSVAEFNNEDSPVELAGVFTRDDFLALRINLHKVLAYMDAYRASLVNLQESYCYYIGVVLNNQSTVYSESGAEIEIEDVNSQWMYDYGYKTISLESLDNFFMFLRTWTNNPNYDTTGSPLDIDLSIPTVLEKFVVQAMNYMCNAVGLTDPTSSPDRAYVACGALRYFLEVTGMILPYATTGSTAEKYLDALCSGEYRRSILACYLTSYLVNGGLLLTTYEMDLNRALLSSNVGNTKSSVDTSTGSFTIDTFRFRNAVQKAIDKFDLSGGRFTSWLRTLWKVKPDKSLDKAELLHVASSYIGNTDIISTANTLGVTGDGDSASGSSLAQQAGYTIGRVDGDTDHYLSDSYGIFICCGSLIPVVSYSQGMDPCDFHLNIQDCFLPDYASFGYQGVPARELVAQLRCVNDVSSAQYQMPIPPQLDSVVGKRVAWQEYRTSVDRATGNFAIGGPLSYWTFARFYGGVNFEDTGVFVTGTKGIKLKAAPNTFSTTTYVWPRLYNYLFAQTDDAAQNFRLTGRVIYKGTRNIPAPRLGDID